MQVTDLCFTAQFTGGDPFAVSGTRWSAAKHDPDQRAILLVQGGVFPSRPYWDGGAGHYGVDNDTTPARAFARAGYVVYTYDRPGYGGSQYNGAGGTHAITLRANVEVLVEVIESIRGGGYSSAACQKAAKPGTASSHLVLGGHSGGAFATMLLLTKAFDISMPPVEAAFMVAWGNHGGTPDILSNIATCQAVHPPMEPNPRFFFPVCPTAGDVSTNCVDMLIHLPTALPNVGPGWCANRDMVAEPIGVAADVAAGMAWIVGHADQVEKIPLLVGFFGQDKALGDPNDPMSAAGQERAMWSHVPAAPQTPIFEDFGHNYFAHRNAGGVNRAFVEWLASSGVGPVT